MDNFFKKNTFFDFDHFQGINWVQSSSKTENSEYVQWPQKKWPPIFEKASCRSQIPMKTMDPVGPQTKKTIWLLWVKLRTINTETLKLQMDKICKNTNAIGYLRFFVDLLGGTQGAIQVRCGSEKWGFFVTSQELRNLSGTRDLCYLIVLRFTFCRNFGLQNISSFLGLN